MVDYIFLNFSIYDHSIDHFDDLGDELVDQLDLNLDHNFLIHRDLLTYVNIIHHSLHIFLHHNFNLLHHVLHTSHFEHLPPVVSIILRRFVGGISNRELIMDGQFVYHRFCGVLINDGSQSRGLLPQVHQLGPQDMRHSARKRA
ncbi:hypothetical protein RQP46_010069 [Phenoliferia psychrophenolica]